MLVCVLLVSKGIVDVHGGSLSVFSEGEGYGSTFTLQLIIDNDSVQLSDQGPILFRSNLFKVPINKLNDHSRVHATQPASIKNMSLSGGDRSGQHQNCGTDAGAKDIRCQRNNDDVCPLTAKILSQQESLCSILIVDDSIPTKSMLSKLLQSRCRRLDQAGDGVEAMRMVEVSKDAGEPYDVIFMDSEMPNMNGPAATRLIREQLGYKGLIIGVTGNALPEDIANFKDHGADDVLVKPLKISQFDEVLSMIRRKYMEV